jgi:hypothetical protein
LRGSGEARRAEILARTLLTGLRDDEDDEDEVMEPKVEPARRLLELLAIELSDLSIESSIGLFASGLGVVCLLVAVSGSWGVIVERLSDEARKGRLM